MFIYVFSIKFYRLKQATELPEEAGDVVADLLASEEVDDDISLDNSTDTGAGEEEDDDDDEEVRHL